MSKDQLHALQLEILAPEHVDLFTMLLDFAHDEAALSVIMANSASLDVEPKMDSETLANTSSTVSQHAHNNRCELF